MAEQTHPAFSTMPRPPQKLYQYLLLHGYAQTVTEQLAEMAGEPWEYVEMKVAGDGFTATVFLLMRREMQ